MAFLLPLSRALESSLAAGSLADVATLSHAIDTGSVASSRHLRDWLAEYMKTCLIPEEGPSVLAIRRALVPLYDDGYRQARTVWMAERLGDDDSGVQSLVLSLDRCGYEDDRPEVAKTRSARIARRYLTVAGRLYPNSGIGIYEGWIREMKCRGQVSIVHGWMAAFFRQDEQNALSTYVLLHLQSCLRAARSAGVLPDRESRAFEQSLLRVVDELVSDFLDVSGDGRRAGLGILSEFRVDIDSESV